MKKALKEKAKILRRRGLSFRQISEELKVSKSTASLWTRKEKISQTGLKRLKNLLIFSQIKARQVLWKKQENYLKELDKNCSVLKDTRYSRDDLKIFLALLYWCEGSKTHKSFKFINSDPRMITTYLMLLRSCFMLEEKKFRVWLHLHDYHNREEMLSFWSKITGIDKNQINVYNKKHSGVRKKEEYRGCISINYGDYKIFDEIMLIIDRFSGLGLKLRD